MRVAFFSTKPYDRRFFESAAADFGHEIQFIEPRLTRQTVALAEGFDAVCVFVNDELDASVLLGLSKRGVKTIALRCAGFNQLDLTAAGDLGVRVVRVPAYSPQAVAEHTLALILCLQRKIHRAYSRVRENNFSLDGLLGQEIAGQQVGVVGTGGIGALVAKRLAAFEADVLAFDVQSNPECESIGVKYVGLNELLQASGIVTLHCPLTAETQHLIRSETIARMRRGVMLVNTSRGGLIDTEALVDGLKSGQIGSVGIDVYEEEEDLFFEDLSDEVLQDDVFARLLTFPNVIVTGHQAFFTERALETIARTTLQNLTDLEKTGACENRVVVSAPE